MSGVGMSGWFLCLDATNSASSVLSCRCGVDCLRRNRAGCYCHDWGRPIKLNPDGTFRFQMSFQDGLIDYPIMAVASDGEQTRSIHMKFNRETPSRHTNTKKKRFRNGSSNLGSINQPKSKIPRHCRGFFSTNMTPEEITNTLTELFDSADVQAITPESWQVET